jgi:hypothetical protein
VICRTEAPSRRRAHGRCKQALPKQAQLPVVLFMVNTCCRADLQHTLHVTVNFTSEHSNESRCEHAIRNLVSTGRVPPVRHCDFRAGGMPDTAYFHYVEVDFVWSTSGRTCDGLSGFIGQVNRPILTISCRQHTSRIVGTEAFRWVLQGVHSQTSRPWMWYELGTIAAVRCKHKHLCL